MYTAAFTAEWNAWCTELDAVAIFTLVADEDEEEQRNNAEEESHVRDGETRCTQVYLFWEIVHAVEIIVGGCLRKQRKFFEVEEVRNYAVVKIKKQHKHCT